MEAPCKTYRNQYSVRGSKAKGGGMDGPFLPLLVVGIIFGIIAIDIGQSRQVGVVLLVGLHPIDMVTSVDNCVVEMLDGLLGALP